MVRNSFRQPPTANRQSSTKIPVVDKRHRFPCSTRELKLLYSFRIFITYLWSNPQFSLQVTS